MMWKLMVLVIGLHLQLYQPADSATTPPNCDCQDQLDHLETEIEHLKKKNEDQDEKMKKLEIMLLHLLPASYRGNITKDGKDASFTDQPAPAVQDWPIIKFSKIEELEDSIKNLSLKLDRELDSINTSLGELLQDSHTQETEKFNRSNSTYSRQRDECKPGFWSFPDCLPCECNGNALSCDPNTGECIDCRDHTTGRFCERCKIGYYGNPIIGENQVPCRPCDTKAIQNSYEETCYLDEETYLPIYSCKDGYGGDRCDICDDNYFGNLEIPGGECKKCNCSDNWDEPDSGNCDPHTGECLKCLFFTEGFNCEHCWPGYFGDAVTGQCSECTCDMLGTDPDRFDCDSDTGECNCMPNVIGDMCDSCKENHWGIASGMGCSACECDVVGSTSPSCNPLFGQCDCKPGFVGRRCDEAEGNF